MGETVHNFCVRNRVSVWLIFMSLCVQSVMMHPNWASFMALGLNAVILVTLRTVAHLEGREHVVAAAAREDRQGL